MDITLTIENDVSRTVYRCNTDMETHGLPSVTCEEIEEAVAQVEKLLIHNGIRRDISKKY